MAGRSMIGTPYGVLDCINLIKAVIRSAPGGVASYTTAGTNTLWRSYDAAPKYRDLTWRQEGLEGAASGMLAFKRSGEDVHHVGLVTGEGTVIHSSSTKGCVVETALDGSWQLLARHRYIEVGQANKEENEGMAALYKAVVRTQTDPLRVRDAPVTGRIIGKVPKGREVDVLTEPANGWPRIRYGELVGYASASYLTRVEHTDEIVPGVTAEAEDATTLVRDDGTQITLIGDWHVADD